MGRVGVGQGRIASKEKDEEREGGGKKGSGEGCDGVRVTKGLEMREDIHALHHSSPSRPLVLGMRPTLPASA